MSYDERNARSAVRFGERLLILEREVMQNTKDIVEYKADLKEVRKDVAKIMTTGVVIMAVLQFLVPFFIRKG